MIFYMHREGKEQEPRAMRSGWYLTWPRWGSSDRKRKSAGMRTEVEGKATSRIPAVGDHGEPLLMKKAPSGANDIMESLILAQNERWRRVLSMQVEG